MYRHLYVCVLNVKLWYEKYAQEEHYYIQRQSNLQKVSKPVASYALHN